MPIDPTFLSNLLLVLIGFGGAFLAALWVSLIIWTYRDIRRRARDTLVHILAALLVAVLNLPGVLVYLILRPPHTLEEEYQRTLEEEALLQTLEDLPLCPGCERRVKDDWQVCPNCNTKLKKACHNCGKLMELPWNICPYCGEPVPGMRREDLSRDLDQALKELEQVADEIKVVDTEVDDEAETIQLKTVSNEENEPEAVDADSEEEKSGEKSGHIE
jgi:RNA polymerase subunit RPABC4/transcription elongation factor Spt4